MNFSTSQVVWTKYSSQIPAHADHFLVLTVYVLYVDLFGPKANCVMYPCALASITTKSM